MSTMSSYFPVPFYLQTADQTAVAQQYALQMPPSVTVPAAYSTAYPTAYATGAPAVAGAYSLPQYQQAQQLFQKDAQFITPEAIENVKAALLNCEVQQKAETKKRAIPCKAAGQTWEDLTLADWPENDFRMFCGDLGNEVNDDVLSKVFSRYSSFNMARVVRDKRTGKSKGYGFVSFANASDLVSALKEMNGKYVGNRPIKLRKSTWKKRVDFEALEKQMSHPQKRPKPVKRSILHK